MSLIFSASIGVFDDFKKGAKKQGPSLMALVVLVNLAVSAPYLPQIAEHGSVLSF